MTVMQTPRESTLLAHASGRPRDRLSPTDTFTHRHIGPNPSEVEAMLRVVGASSLDELVGEIVPESIRLDRPLNLPGAGADRGEHELLESLHAMASKNQVFRSCIGMGYCETITPQPILRNVLQNPGWYTQYTPYQAEIAQGRLEALLNFQTMVADLTGLPLAGASLLDEGTAAAEAMGMCFAIAPKKAKFVVADHCHPQTIEVMRTRAGSLGIELVVTGLDAITDELLGESCGVLVQYPDTSGQIEDFGDLASRAKAAGALTVAATDLLALTLLRPPGEWGADVAVGSAQRFGVPMGFGGPHAAFISTRDEFARKLPGRIIGVSRDSHGKPALRMAIQTREQHIKRDRATSNICTAQALLAVISSFYGVYHGPEGVTAVARRVRGATELLAGVLEGLGHTIVNDTRFDTLRVELSGTSIADVRKKAIEKRINFRYFEDGTVGIALGETVDAAFVEDIASCFANRTVEVDSSSLDESRVDYPAEFARTSAFMTHPVFNTHHSETELLRYMKELENRDLSLAHSMIPLGSCTMKLNATSEMVPVTWPEFGALHPFAPREQWEGYAELFRSLESWLAEITGFSAVSLQPNAGSQGEYAGLMVIRAYHEARGQKGRDVCLIPTSAHGTNPASAVIAGMKVVAVKCDERGNIDIADLRAKAEANAETLGAIMVTYPSTHGVFEEGIREICEIVHEFGGQVYMDGANMNAQLGLCRPGDMGADVCHLNLHKTFCIPHGGGGPGMGPIGVAPHLVPHLPGHPVISPLADSEQAIGPISAAPYGSASILPISWVYIALMGAEGLKRATEVAILSANYMAKRLEGHYDIVYTGKTGRVAHEFIIDCRAFDKSAGVKIDDIAKRLVDYGFHAPTMAWPVPGTLMIEPTESEPMTELDRYVNALIAIREEIAKIERGEWPREDNPLRHAPHTIEAVSADEWTHPYSRETAAYPAPWLRDVKFWSSVGRVDNPYGDRNLVCTCPSVEEMAG